MPKNKGWFRVYDRVIDSPEILELSDTEFRIIVSLWSLASAGGQEDGEIQYKRGVLWRRVAPQMSKDDFLTALDNLAKVGLLIDAEGFYKPKDWVRHQYTFDSKKPSIRKRKERSREVVGNSSGSDGEQLGQQDTDTDSDTDTDAESDTDPAQDAKKEAEEKTRSRSAKLAEFVTMTEDEHQKLIEEYGEVAAKEMILMLDDYKGASGKKYKSDYRAIRSWVVGRWKKNHIADKSGNHFMDALKEMAWEGSG